MTAAFGTGAYRDARAACVVACAFVVGCGGGGGGSTVAAPTTPTTVAVSAIPAAFESISRTLDAQPPQAHAPNRDRSTAIAQFDALLWATDATRATPPDVIDYYAARMARVATELAQPVTTGFRVWAMYNHGFIVKTASTTLAFDVVEGKGAYNGPIGLCNCRRPCWTASTSCWCRTITVTTMT